MITDPLNPIDVLAALLHLIATGDTEHLKLYLVTVGMYGQGALGAWARAALDVWRALASGTGVP